MSPPLPAKVEGRATFRALDPATDRDEVDRLLARAVPDDYLLSMLDRWLASPTIVGAFDGEHLVGIEKLDDLGMGEGWLGAMRVAPERRREGWGRRLTAYAFELAKASGIQVLRLVIEDENVASRALSKGLGFRPVASLAHVVGLAPGPAPAEQAERAEPGKVALKDVPGPELLEGLRGTQGFLLTTFPRAMRYVRASLPRLQEAHAAGHLVTFDPDPLRGLALLGAVAPWSREPGRGMRLLVPLGSDVEGIFQGASAAVRSEGDQLEGFLPDDEPLLRRLRAQGWETGERAHWGEHVHLYEAPT